MHYNQMTFKIDFLTEFSQTNRALKFRIDTALKRLVSPQVWFVLVRFAASRTLE